MKVRRVDIAPHVRTVVFRFRIRKFSGFLAKLLYAVAYVAAGVGCVSAAPRVGTRLFCHGSLRGFGLGLESGRHGVPPLPKLRPDGWD